MMHRQRREQSAAAYRTPATFQGVVGVLAALSCVWIGTTTARADLDRFPYTYSWWTASKNEVEFGWRHVQPTTAQHWQDMFELEYGVTDRYTVEAYLLETHGGGFRDYTLSSGDGDGDEGEGGGGSQIFDPIHNGAAYRSGGYLIEQRYRFGDYRTRRLLPAAYLEYEHRRDAKPALESKLILQYDPDGQDTLVFNLIAGQPLQKGGSASWGYSFGGSHIIGKEQHFWAGAEAFGNWSGNQHWAGPSVGAFIDEKTRIVGTYGKHLHGTGQGDQFQILVSRELF